MSSVDFNRKYIEIQWSLLMNVGCVCWVNVSTQKYMALNSLLVMISSLNGSFNRGPKPHGTMSTSSMESSLKYVA